MIDMRRLSDDLTEAFIGYQHRLDNPFPSSTETEAVVTAKYMNDPVFHAKVRSLVVGVMDIVSRSVAEKGEAAQPQVPEGYKLVPSDLLTKDGIGKVVIVPEVVKGRFSSEMFWRGVYETAFILSLSAKEEGK